MLRRFIIALAIIVFTQAASAQIIDTVAGNGLRGFSGDGGPATDAKLSFPTGVALDGSGNLFIADQEIHRIRRVDAVTGIITTVAGFFFAGFNGDGIAATSARLWVPTRVALDGSGNLYIVDKDNQRIRRVDAGADGQVTGAPDETITTVAGTGIAGFSGDGGLATSSRLRFPRGVVVDGSGNLFIADAGNHRIRRVDNSTGIITTVAGTGIAGFSGDGGLATSARLSSPRGVALDSSGNLFIADRDNHIIRRVDADTGIITTVAGNGSCCFNGDGIAATSAWMHFPSGVVVDGSGNLFIADRVNNRIRRVDAGADGLVTGAPDETITTVAGNGNLGFNGDGIAATSAWMANTFDVAMDGSGNLFIADSFNRRIRHVLVIPVNSSPTVAVLTALVTENEGSTAANTGTYDDADTGDNVTISASVGAVSKTGTNSGTWSWSFGTTDGPDSQDVTITADDGNGGIATTTFALSVSNVPPTVTLSGPNTASEGATNSYNFTVTDPGNDTFSIQAGFPSCGTGGSLTGSPTTTASGGSFQCLFPDGPASSTVEVQVADSDGAIGTSTLGVTVNNVAPMVSFNISANPIAENDSIILTGFISDPGFLDSQTVTIDWGDSSPPTGFELAVGILGFITDPHQYLDDNPTGTPLDVNSITVTVTDKDSGAGIASGNVTVNNLAPVLTGVTGPLDPLALGSEATVSASFTDVGTQDTHTCTFAWDDGEPDAAGTASGGSCSAPHTYAAAGVFTVGVTVTDDDTGSTSQNFEFVVIFDPSAGFVTGGGFINSPPGAYTADPSLTGKANFGFVSKYKKGANVPTGQTQFKFKVANFNFHSTIYEWLVIAGPKAQYKGTGTVNGTGDFGFLLTTTDGQQPGGGGEDKFRIKIVDKNNNGEIVYDNVPGESEDIDSANPQVLGGGSIVIHSK